MSVVERFTDAAAMFWQSLNDSERRALVVGACWLAYFVATVPLERARNDRERDRLADAIAERLTRG